MSDDPRLKALLARREQMRQSGATVNLEELCADCPDLLPLLRARVEHEAPFTDSHHELLTSEFVAGTQIGLVVPRRGALPVVPGFEIIKELGRGGMGVVYKARHLKLGRLVALKMVLAGSHASRSALTRFNIEAEAIASLDHPNIVQLYEVGEHENCPYLVLELIEGGDLDDLIENRPQEPRAAAQLVEALARAMHVAHLRGIVHRDLKPANILLQEDASHRRQDAREEGSFRSDTEAYGSALRLGEGAAVIPKITDFGLAKRLESESHTQSGMVFGTPSYMAPEQALGKVREIGPAADVYALGAILYACLTSKPPFSGTSLVDTLSLVRTGEVIPPRQLIFDGHLPRDLETICLKCLHKEPSGRYASAEALADDLRRFLNSEPIAARPVGRVERLRLWAKRRPALAGLVGVSVVAVLLLLAGGIWSDLRIRDALKSARDNERKAQDRLTASLDAVDQFYVKVATTWLDDKVRLVPQQIEFLDLALKQFKRFSEEGTDDPRLRERQGIALMRMGQIQEKLSHIAEAENAFREAIALQRSLCDQHPGEVSHRQNLAATLNWQGEMFRKTNRPEQARASYVEAIAIQERLVNDVPNNLDYHMELGRTTYNYGLLQAGRNRNGARANYDRAIKFLESAQGNPEARQHLSQAWLNVGVLEYERDNHAESERAFTLALAQLDILHRLDERKPDYRYDRAVALIGLGNLLAKSMGQRAESSYVEAEKILHRLVEDYPERPLYAAELANACNSLGTLQYTQKRGDCGEASWLRAAQTWQQLLKKYPTDTEYLHSSGVVQGNLGLLYLDKPQLSRAIVALETAVDHLERASKAQPDNKQLAGLTVQRLRTLARAYLRGEQLERAAGTASRVFEHSASTDTDHYSAAAVLAVCAARAMNNNAQGTADEKRLRRDDFAKRAVKALGKVDPKQFQKAFGVASDKEFQILHDREDFRALAADWQRLRR